MGIEVRGQQKKEGKINMHLRQELVLPQAWAKKVKVQITAEDPKINITIRTALTREVAEAFGCRDIIYAGDVPRSGIDKINLEGEQIDPEFHLKNDSLAFYAVANSMGKYVAHMEGTGPVLEFEIRLTGFAELVVDLACRVKVDPMELILKPAQIPLELHEEKKPAEKEDGPCVSCNNEQPLVADDPSLHINGQPCVNYKPAEPEEPAGATIAPAAVMGGTHQRGRRKAAAATAKAEPEFMADEPEPVVN